MNQDNPHSHPIRTEVCSAIALKTIKMMAAVQLSPEEIMYAVCFAAVKTSYALNGIEEDVTPSRVQKAIIAIENLHEKTADTEEDASE